MKHYIDILLVPLMAAFVLSACIKDDGSSTPKEYSISVSESALSFTADSTGRVVTATSSSQSYAVSSQPDWLSALPGSYGGGKTDFTVIAQKNSSTESRSGYISFVCGDSKIEVAVTQAGQTVIPESLAFLDEVTPLENEAWELSRKLGLGWNLGNQMEANTNGVADETCWGNSKATQATFDRVKALGFKSVRIPVSWMGHIGEYPDCTVDSQWLDRVAEIAGYAHNAGLNAIINTHHDGGDSQSWLNILKASESEEACDTISGTFAALWKQIAEKFSGEGDWLIFEPFNELNDGDWGSGKNLTDGGKQYAIVNEWNQLFVNTVRAAGGCNADRYLMVAGYCSNATFAMEQLVLPEDSTEGRLIVTVHCYDPWEYTINYNYQEWGHTGAVGKKPADGEKEFVKLYAALKTKYIDNNIPVCIGECGLSNRSDERSRAFEKYYLEFTVHTAKMYGMSTFLWDNGVEGSEKEADGFLHHGTGEFINNSSEMLGAMNKAFYNEDPDYTLRSIYNNAPK